MDFPKAYLFKIIKIDTNWDELKPPGNKLLNDDAQNFRV